MSTTTAPALKWKTVVNGTHKRATTHFGVVYELIKDTRKGGSQAWLASVAGPGSAVHVLADGVSFADARAAAIVDNFRNGGR